MPPADVSAVVVCSFEPPEAVRGTVESLLAQTAPPAEILVVDNHPEAVVSTALLDAGLPVRALRPGRNLGYPAACDFAAPHARHAWMFFLNPDAFADPSCLERLLDAAGDDVAILGAQVLLPDGQTVNAGDNPVHLAGLSWSGRYLEPREDGPPRDVAAVSGAALLARTSVYRDLGGHCPGFFLYVDDTDLAWRARMAGWTVRFVPRATIRHDFDFDKGARKWFQLEHNRAWMVLANYQGRTLLLLAPLLLIAEAGIALLARRDGWWPEKRRAWVTVAREWRDVGRWRRHVQRGRRVGDAAVLAPMTASLRTPLVQTAAAERAEPLLRAYRAAVLAALGGPPRPTAERPTLLLYDHDCNFCVWMIALVLRHDHARALRPEPIQSTEGERHLADLDPGTALASWHAVTPDGRRFSGGDAFPAVLGAVPRFALLGRLAARTPGPLRRWAYRLVAERRVGLSRLVPRRAKDRARADVAALRSRP